MSGGGIATEWQAWGARRPAFRGVHLDNGAAGRSSSAVLQAACDHARLEAQTGAYVAEEAVAPVLDTLRADLAAQLGAPADGVALVESATAALRGALSVWPVRAGDSVAVTPSEWGPNRQVFAARGLSLVELAVDGDGVLDLESLERTLTRTPPAVVALTQVASHRGLVQPVRAAAVLCRAAGVPLWVDVAQAIGHVDTANGADVLYGTSRKWLAGPRGVGVLAVAEQWWDTLQVAAPTLPPGDWPVVRNLESHEAHVAGRVGLATAVREYLADGPAQVWARLAEVGRLTRATLAGLPGWEVVPAADHAGAITALRPADGQDVVTVRARLLDEHGLLTTAALPPRAPGDMPTPLLRVSPQVDCSVEQLVALRTALASS
jgi:pyridoxal 5-phosphate dependent beta-lyase